MLEPRFHRYGIVESTNDIALAMARRGEPEGTIVTALSQTGGRGRMGRKWWDKPGDSLLMSVILAPDVPVSRIPELSFVVSLSTAQYLKSGLGIDARLKWPNDVIVNGKKIAGILIEVTHSHNGPAAVAGIGININQLTFPDELVETTTSAANETGRHMSVEDLSEPFAKALFANYEVYLACGFEEISERWHKYMWGIGSQADVAAQGLTLRGVISGIDAAGGLLITDERDVVHTVFAADYVRMT